MANPIKLLLLSTMMFLQFVSCGQYDKSFKKSPDKDQTIDAMLSLMIGDAGKNKETLQSLEDTWVEGYVPMLIEVLYLSRDQVNRKPIVKLLEKKTNKKYGSNILKWLDWLWSKDQEILHFQGDWMSSIYKSIDPKFEKYFKNRTRASLIRLDEVRWGGVVQDGIPPLRNPKMLKASEADYLEDDHIVFGVSINGDHRAYPKRILAWHEMFVDEIGGESIAGVYCTLCGTVIAYNTRFNGKQYDLGTSGFLYRSNKLMYDQATQSLWNTIEGKPVVGPLINSNIALKSHSVVTTTWGAWKKLHPDSKVLSLETSYRRNYDEGVAYQQYFATDQLMFTVPELDTRLLNKAEVLIVRAEGYEDDPLAISTDFLSRHKVYQDKISETSFVVVTDKSGANRVYESKDHTFKKVTENKLKDKKGNLWEMKEEQLISPDGEILSRLSYHRIFWFAWYNTYRETRLVR